MLTSPPRCMRGGDVKQDVKQDVGRHAPVKCLLWPVLSETVHHAGNRPPTSHSLLSFSPPFICLPLAAPPARLCAKLHAAARAPMPTLPHKAAHLYALFASPGGLFLRPVCPTRRPTSTRWSPLGNCWTTSGICFTPRPSSCPAVPAVAAFLLSGSASRHVQNESRLWAPEPFELLQLGLEVGGWRFGFKGWGSTWRQQRSHTPRVYPGPSRMNGREHS
eukprot:364358-Chlamydomonas_euryale.AAC.10